MNPYARSGVLGTLSALGLSALGLMALLATAVAQTPPAPPPRPADLRAPESHGSAIDLDIPVPPHRPADLPGGAPAQTAAPAVPSAPAATAPPPATLSPTTPGPMTPAPTAPVPTAPSLATTPPPGPPAASEKDLAVCKALLESGTVVARTMPPIVGPGECGIDAPVALEAIVLADKRKIGFKPGTALRCDLAAALARWVSEDVVPMLAAQNLVLEGITDADAYSCRSRNHVAGAKISEHGKGNAIDLDAFLFAPNKRISLTSPEAAPFVAQVKASACARFTTILGPGSDGYHNNHIHLDLEDRRTHGTLCQWNLSPAGPPPPPAKQ